MFKVKKSSLSRKLTLGRSPSSSPGYVLQSREAVSSFLFFRLSLPDNLDQATISAQTNSPSYTKAYLEELKASTPSTPANKNTLDNAGADISFGSSLDVSEVFDVEGAVVENLSEVASGASFSPRCVLLPLLLF